MTNQTCKCGHSIDNHHLNTSICFVLNCECKKYNQQGISQDVKTRIGSLACQGETYQAHNLEKSQQPMSADSQSLSHKAIWENGYSIGKQERDKEVLEIIERLECPECHGWCWKEELKQALNSQEINNECM